jgi:sRNA-binding protein
MTLAKIRTPVLPNQHRGNSTQVPEQLLLAQNSLDSQALAARADEVIATLARLWPQCFFVPQSQRRPPMVGIHEALRELMLPAIKAGKISTLDIAVALRRYTGSDGYLEHYSIFNNTRIGLDGEPAGRVSHSQACYSRELLRVGRA